MPAEAVQSWRVQEDVVAHKIPCTGRLGGARDELGCKDMYDVLKSFICHEPPKWVFSLNYINKISIKALLL